MNRVYVCIGDLRIFTFKDVPYIFCIVRKCTQFSYGLVYFYCIAVNYKVRYVYIIISPIHTKFS